MTEAIGWLSSIVLLLTVGKQVHKQWKERSAEGVSRWLFVGQMTASCGFVVYSALLHNLVYVATNALMLVTAIAGWAITRHNKRRAAAAGSPAAPTGALPA